MRYLLLFAPVFFLTSCGPTAEEWAEIHKARAEKLRLEDETACTGYGFRKGTENFALCMQQESHNREQLAASQAAQAAAERAARRARRAATGY